MARIQILELPTIYREHGDDETPFVLIVDQYVPERHLTGLDQVEPVSQWNGLAERIGARAVLVFEEAIEIPANEVPIGPDGYPVRLRVVGDFTGFRQQIEEQIKYVEGRLG